MPRPAGASSAVFFCATASPSACARRTSSRANATSSARVIAPSTPCRVHESRLSGSTAWNPCAAQPSNQPPTTASSAVRLAAVEVSRTYSPGQSGSVDRPAVHPQQQVGMVGAPEGGLVRLALEGVDVADVVEPADRPRAAVAVDDAGAGGGRVRHRRAGSRTPRPRVAGGRPAWTCAASTPRPPDEPHPASSSRVAATAATADRPPRTPQPPRARSPAPAAGDALERPDDVVGDPPAVEAALLRTHPLAVDRALERRRVEGQEPAMAANPGVGVS